MSKSSGKQQLHLAKIGPISDALIAELSPHLELTAANTAGAAGSLFDASHAIDRAALEQALHSRHRVVIANPHAETYATLVAITGLSPGGELAAVIYKKEPHGGFSYQSIPAAGPKTMRAVHHPVGLRLARALSGETTCAPPSNPPASMLANTGSLAGWGSGNFTDSWSLSPPACSGNNDDTLITTAQDVSICANIVWYVYYVNGAGSDPYYAVFAAFQCTTTCDPVSNPNTNLGWFSPTTQLWLSGPSYPAATSPPSGSAENTTVYLADSLPLLGTTAGGDNLPYQFNPSMGVASQFPNWSYLQTGWSAATIWNFYQNTPWNPIYFTPQTYGAWYDTNYILFDPSWNIMTQTDLSLTPYTWQVMGEWYVFPDSTQTPPYTTAPSQEATFNYAAVPNWFAVHNSSGCLQNCPGYGHNHQFQNYFFENYNNPAYLDLGQLANTANLTQPVSSVAAGKRSRS